MVGQPARQRPWSAKPATSKAREAPDQPARVPGGVIRPASASIIRQQQQQQQLENRFTSGMERANSSNSKENGGHAEMGHASGVTGTCPVPQRPPIEGDDAFYPELWAGSRQQQPPHDEQRGRRKVGGGARPTSAPLFKDEDEVGPRSRRPASALGGGQIGQKGHEYGGNEQYEVGGGRWGEVGRGGGGGGGGRPVSAASRRSRPPSAAITTVSEDDESDLLDPQWDIQSSASTQQRNVSSAASSRHNNKQARPSSSSSSAVRVTPSGDGQAALEGRGMAAGGVYSDEEEEEEEEGDYQLEEGIATTKVFWLDKFGLKNLQLSTEATKVTPEFLEWKRKRDAKKASVGWKVRDTKANALRRAAINPAASPPKDNTVPVEEALRGVKQRVIDSIGSGGWGDSSNLEVACETLLREIPLLDSLGSDALRRTAKVAPREAAMWQELWACTIQCMHKSISSQLDQTVTLQEEMRTSESEHRRSSMTLSKLQTEHTKIKSQYERKSTEVTRLGKELVLAREECSRLREGMMRGGVGADFDPLRVEDALSAMNEAEVHGRAGARVIEEMSKLLEAAVPLDDVRSKKVLEVGKTLPGKFRAELSKFSTKIADLQRELSDKDAEIADLKESLRISRGKEINLPMPLECYTPRPNWPRIFDEVIPQLATAPLGRPGVDVTEHGGGSTMRDATYPGASSDRTNLICDALNQLLPDEHRRSRKVKAGEYLDPLGTGDHVPPFLRYKLPVKNNNISKHETEHLINEIWHARSIDLANSERAGVKPSTFNDFFYKYLQMQYGNFQGIICEQAYNLMDGCRRFNDDADVELFEMLVNGEVGEEVVHDQSGIIDSLWQRLKRTDISYHSGQFKGYLPRDRFEKALRAHFPYKSKIRMAVLASAVTQSHPMGKHVAPRVPVGKKGEVVYEDLFHEDENYDQGPFLEALRDQYCKERDEFLELLLKNLSDIAPPNGVLSADLAKKALLLTDPGLPDEEVHRLYMAGMGISPSRDNPPGVLPGHYTTFHRNTKAVHVRWFSHSAAIEVNGMKVHL